uniref:NADH dehydrogenase [ubiquinone] 1 beta subcomplex subunit 11, mitochondrial n=1 Tax=Ciona savignyi TaxID=51511 RepID=H2Y6F5_CIOSA
MLLALRCLRSPNIASVVRGVCRNVSTQHRVVLGKNFISVTILKRNLTKQPNVSQESTAIAAKSEYEIECQRFIDQDKPVTFYGFDRFDPVIDHFILHMVFFLGFSMLLVFCPAMLVYGPDYRSRMVEWREYEAIELLEKREANGEPPIDPNFAPADLIESMVPRGG